MSVLVLGAGVAGHSAVCWLHDWKLPYTWLDDRPQTGGVLRRLHNPLHNTPGQRHPHGASLADALDAERAALHIPPPTRAAITHATHDARGITLHAANQTFGPAHTLILATGTRYRTLDVPGEAEGLAAGYVHQSASGAAHRVAGKPAVMIGGGDAAYEGALILARHGCPVTLLQRGPTSRAQAHFIAEVAQHPLIRVLTGQQVVSIAPTPAGCAVLTADGARHEAAGAFVRIGVAPRLPALWAALDLDAEGYVVVDAAQRTNLPGVLAAGDVTDNPLRSVVCAAGAGARAAHTARA